MTILENKGNTKLVNENGYLVAYYNSEKIDLHYSIYYDNQGSEHIVSWNTGNKLLTPYGSNYNYHAEVINGIGILVNSFYDIYPNKFTSEQPQDGPSYYLAYQFSINDGQLNKLYGIDRKDQLNNDDFRPNIPNLELPESILKTTLWGAPSDYTTGSYLNFRESFKNIIEPNTSSNKIDKSYSGNFRDYNFFNRGLGKYEIQTSEGYDDITGISSLHFSDKVINFQDEIVGTFDQITGLNTDSGKMFRLYNAAFSRFPDADGLRYWISNFSSGIDDERAVSSSFLASTEFKERYGENITNETYVETLYLNVLNRELDQGGYDYWVGNLNNGIEERHEVLLGFSESLENKILFTEMTGFG